MLVPHHRIPPISGKGYTPLSRVLVTIGNYKKHPLFRVFSGNLPETTAKKYPPLGPFLRKWEYACGPLMHSSMCACVWVGVGGGVSIPRAGWRACGLPWSAEGVARTSSGPRDGIQSQPRPPWTCELPWQQRTGSKLSVAFYLILSYERQRGFDYEHKRFFTASSEINNILISHWHYWFKILFRLT